MHTQHLLPWLLTALLLSVAPRVAAQPSPAPPVAEPEAPKAAPKTVALLLNGGAAKRANFLSHFEHIQEIMEVLIRRGVRRDAIVVFNADGEDDEEDMATRDTPRWPSGYRLFDLTQAGKLLRPGIEYEDSDLRGVQLRPAKKRDLRRWFTQEGAALRSGDTLLLYVTDHGQRGERDLDNGTISLWNEKLSVHELREMLERLKPGVRVVMMMSQCFSGTFAAAMYPSPQELPTGDTCGYFSTTRDRFAYGCYPEGRAQQRLGHAFTLVDALYARSDLPSVQDQVTLFDGTPDVPLSTSDVYMERLLRDAARERGVTLAGLVDPLLAQALKRDPEAWRGDLEVIDQLAEAYGMIPPRQLEAIEGSQGGLSRLAREMDQLARSWSDAQRDLQQANLEAFLNTPTGRRWVQQLDPRRLKRLDEARRAHLRQQLSQELERFTRQRPERWRRLERVEQNAERADAAQYRMEVRAAVALRLRNRLLRVAGQIWLMERRDDPRAGLWGSDAAQALERLRACEATAIGTAPGTFRPREVVELPPLPSDVEALRELSPTWLGVRFAPPSRRDRRRMRLSAGAVIVKQVEPGSPAQAAGLQPGDILIGTAEGDFAYEGELRLWVMTSPPDTPQTLRLVRKQHPQEVTVTFTKTPLQSELAAGGDLAPIAVGDRAPPLSALSGQTGARLDLTGKPHLLFFWTPGCEAVCRHALREAMAWSLRSGVEVVALGAATDAERDAFFTGMPSPLPLRRVADQAGLSFKGHGVRGGPAFVLVDAEGVVRHQQLGWRRGDPLTFNRWRPSDAQKEP